MRQFPQRFRILRRRKACLSFGCVSRRTKGFHEVKSLYSSVVERYIGNVEVPGSNPGRGLHRFAESVILPPCSIADKICEANPILVLKASGNLSFASGERVKIAKQFALSKSFCCRCLTPHSKTHLK